MSLDERISGFIARIYQNADDWTAFDSVARELMSLTQGHLLLVATADLRRQEYTSSRFYGPENTAFAQGVQEFAEGQYASDPTLAWVGAHPEARFCDSRIAVAQADYLDHPHIKWNKSRFGSTHWVIGYSGADDGLSFGMSLHPHAAIGPPRPSDARLFRMLFNHMDTAVRLAARPPDPSCTTEAIIFLNRGGEVLFVSDGAKSLLGRGGPLALEGRRLRAKCTADTRKRV